MKLRAELGLTIIIVTHDLGLAWTVADRVAIMYLGRIVEIGPAEDVLLNPFHPYTKALLDVVPEAGGLERPILAGEPPDPTRIPPDVASIPVVPWWLRARRPSSASRRAAKVRTWRWRCWRPSTKRRAIRHPSKTSAPASTT